MGLFRIVGPLFDCGDVCVYPAEIFLIGATLTESHNRLVRGPQNHFGPQKLAKTRGPSGVQNGD